MALFERLVVPIADEEDAVATARALSPYLDDIQRITVAHVVEKGGGVVDKAPMEKRLADGASFVADFESQLGEAVAVETRIEFGTNVAATIAEIALDADATAIVFCPRGGSRLERLLTGDTAARLMADSELPVVSINETNPTHSAPKRSTSDDNTEVSG